MRFGLYILYSIRLVRWSAWKVSRGRIPKDEMIRWSSGGSLVNGAFDVLVGPSGVFNLVFVSS